ncbi:SecA subunit of pre protein translocase [Coniochaeta sp. 2T2.1]|nr:SecA subunit of pre protein translocase [Coniochaeta sp. 2T2.1]
MRVSARKSAIIFTVHLPSFICPVGSVFELPSLTNLLVWLSSPCKMYISELPLLALLSLLCTTSQACSRVNYHGGPDDGERIVVGRSMDFVASTNSSIYVFPAGTERNASGENMLTWKAKYGSVITAMYDKVTIDGMNTEGLVGNFLYLGVSDYGARNVSRPGLPIGWWLQYFLDSYATVDVAAADLRTTSGQAKFQVVTAALVPGVSSTGHLSLTDRRGDSLIMEVLEGKLVTHHGAEYTVMTNDPPFEQQLAIDQYWEPISNFSLPGTASPADRFARLSHYNRRIPKSTDEMSAVAYTAGMIRAVSTPMVEAAANASSLDTWPTLWRTYSDTKDMVYFYESALEPKFLWTSFEDHDFVKGGVKRLEVSDATWQERVGDMKGKFIDGTVFQPIGAGE